VSHLPVSFTNLRIVTEEMLADRIKTIKTLAEDADEAYMIEKDAETGEHYLHYAVRHLNVAAGGAEEAFHHLMPLEHDDVIALALGVPDFTYFVWFDPDGAGDQAGRFDAIAGDIRAKLEAFRQKGRGGEEDTKRLMEEIDRLFPPK
jgi:hypothetical protein